ncbi:hypothetical protein [Sulfurimonas sp.]
MQIKKNSTTWTNNQDKLIPPIMEIELLSSYLLVNTEHVENEVIDTFLELLKKYNVDAYSFQVNIDVPDVSPENAGEGYMIYTVMRGDNNPYLNNLTSLELAEKIVKRCTAEHETQSDCKSARLHHSFHRVEEFEGELDYISGGKNTGEKRWNFCLKRWESS